MNKLNQLDSIFTENRYQLNDIIKQYEFEPQFEFTLNQNIDYSLLKLISYPGIYKIEIKISDDTTIVFNDWINKFRELWEHEDYKRHFVPNIKIKRVIANHPDSTIWFPLYIGKSKNISTRINEHIRFKLSRNTTAMKLLERVNIYENEFRISTIKINVANYDLIVPEFENYFRDKINPILGRQ